jgi:AGCS family alanine or glycine:cation symporter
MVEFILNINTKINSVVWGPPMLIALIAVGIFLTVITKSVQFTKFVVVMRETLGKVFRKGPKAEGDVTPFQALTVAMGGTVGVGNIAGVATAIALGGPGAIFWMWISGLVGMATKFGEVVLGMRYRVREKDGPMMGGPMTYILHGMGSSWHWLAALFSVFGALAAFGIGNMVQANAVAEGLEHFGIAPWITGVVLVISVGLVTIGGIKRIANVAMIFVPFMCTMYIIGTVVIIIAHISHVPEALRLIVVHAFSPSSAVGGFAGASVGLCIKYGIARGVFSNEAGLGSAPIAHATATTDHPVRQGLWGILEVFIDTIVMCTLTALAIMATGVWSSGATGATLTMAAFETVFGTTLGFSIVVLSMVLTAYDTNLAWCFYGETCSAFLFGRGKGTRTIYRFIWLPFILIGAIGGLEAIWGVSDTLNGMMAIPNVIALFALGGVVAKLTKQFFGGYYQSGSTGPPNPQVQHE